MKSHLKIAAAMACAMLATSSAWGADDAARKKAEDEVRQAVNAKLAAYASTDVDKYFSSYASNMSLCCSDGGWWSRSGYYAMWKDLVAKGGGNSKAAAVDLRLQASPEADVVIASYQMPITSRGQNPQDMQFNMTEVWVKTDGRWQVHALQFGSGKAGASGPATMATK